ncbi:YjbH domain-containing protein [Paraburkholderia caffeinilytica]|uniref:YjbH domain-containing protein n=1 Tax=Paraburkholderia caffeinilytica TaxID=1761016 RepID=UPI0038BB2E74
MSKKKTASRDCRGYAWLSCVFACVLPVHALAGVTESVVAPVYLGEWLAARQASIPFAVQSEKAGALYGPGLSWRSGKEVDVQEQRRQRLLGQINALPALKPAALAARDRVADLIAARQATGRVVVKSADARWLQTNPAQDPYLEDGDVIVIPDRPATVTVVRTDGTLCVRPHTPDVEALQYVLACDSGAAPDIAWIAQPDGTVTANKVAAWNRGAQDLPAPGSWIWAPDRSSIWTPDVSLAIADFLATQGVSGFDPAGAPLQPSGPAPRQQTEFFFDTPTRSSSFPVTGSDWGTVGILQTPTARMNEAGEASISVSQVAPYTRLNFTLQPLDWLEVGFRYTNLSNQLYGPASLSGTQTYKDKSIDAKFRLWRESAYIPEFSVGFRDIGGTGLFSGEYLVASKRTGPFDWSLGLGWGYVGARGDLPNPLSVLSSRFSTRTDDATSSGGSFSIGSWFRGRTSPFGGVQYQTPWEPLVLKLEYDGNDYKHEPFGTVLPARSPINIGAVYRATRNIDLTVGYERGERVMFGVSLHGNLANAAMPKIGDPPPMPITAPAVGASAPVVAPSPADSLLLPMSRTVPAVSERDWSGTVADLQKQTGWHVQSVRELGPELIVEFDYVDAFYLQDRIDRVATILNRDAPLEVRSFRIVPLKYGVPVADYRVQRAQWLASHTRALIPQEQGVVVTNDVPLSRQSINMLPPVFEQEPKRFNISVGPAYQQTLGGPDGFLLYQLSLNALAEFRLTRDVWLSGDLNVGLIDNYDKFKYTAPSDLPRVRTYMREYLTSSRVTIPFLQATKFGKFSNDQYFSVYGGLLESMFAGVGGEWLYRPQDSRLAIGVDLNAVRQRGFRQDFAMRDYQALTGHVTAYWNTGWQNVQVNLSVGQYLAKDKGVTLDVSRHFHNGVVMGAYATKTNVSSAQFGEGSFDKGIYVTIPFDAMMTRSSGGTADLRWSPLTRDGGAKLDRQYPLYNMTDMNDPRSLWYGPAGEAVAP